MPAGSRRQCLAQDSAATSGLKRQQPRDGTPVPKNDKSGPTAGKKSMANCRRTEGNQPSVKETGKNHQSDRDRPDTVHSTRSWRRQVRRSARTGPDSADSAQSVQARQSQFIDEDIETSLSRRRCSPDSEDRVDSSVAVPLLRAQKSARTPQDQSNEKRVDDTVITQTSSHSSS